MSRDHGVVCPSLNSLHTDTHVTNVNIVSVARVCPPQHAWNCRINSVKFTGRWLAGPSCWLWTFLVSF